MAPPSGASSAAAGCTIRLTTQLGCYVLSRPLPAYKKVWAELQAQAALASEVMQVGRQLGAVGWAARAIGRVPSPITHHLAHRLRPRIMPTWWLVSARWNAAAAC